MNQISLNLSKFTLPKKPASKESEAHFERSYWIDEVRKLVGKPFIQMKMRTAHLSIDELKDMYLKACSFKACPSGLFWKLLNETKK